MITRAQLNAALGDLEERIAKDADLRLAAKVADLRLEVEERLDSLEARPEPREEYFRLLVDESSAQLREDCRRNSEDIRALRSRMEELERIIDILAGYFAPAEEAAEGEGEIRDDFGS